MSAFVNGPDESVIYFAGDSGLLSDRSRALLAKRGYRLRIFATAQQILEVLDSQASGWLLAQFELPDINAAELIRQLRRRNIFIGAIVIGKAELASAVAALRAGALDYIAWPIADTALMARLSRYL